MVIAEQHSVYMLQAGEKVKGSLFEAYVAGVYYSFLHPRDEETLSQRFEGVRGASGLTSEDGDGSELSPSKTEDTVDQEHDVFTAPPSAKRDDAVPHDTVGDQALETKCDSLSTATEQQAPTLQANQAPREHPIPNTRQSINPSSPPKGAHAPSTARTHGQAFDHLCSWLWPLFYPVAEFLKSHLGSQSELTQELAPLQGNQVAAALVPELWRVEDTLAAGAIGALNQFLGRNYGCGYLPTWLTKRKGEQVWKMTCIVKTPEGKEM